MEIWKNTVDLFLDGEVWKNIEGYEDYQISNFGRIKSLKFKREKILRQCKMNTGYLYVNLSRNGNCKTKQIHILMFENFNNCKLKDDECVHHLDENKLNNDLNNFQLMNKSDHNSFHNSKENHPLFGKHHSEKSKKLISEKRKEKFKNNELNLSGENHPLFGKHHSEKSKKLISEKRKEKFKNNELNLSGENNPRSILTEQDVIKIIKLIDEGILTQKEIAKIFGVGESTISKIKNKKIWKNEKREKNIKTH